MAEAEYWRFTVARDCQKKNTSENHSECSLARVAAAMDAERRVALSVPRPPPAPLVDSGWTLDGARPTPAPEF
jgi:hypothetical protein